MIKGTRKYCNQSVFIMVDSLFQQPIHMILQVILYSEGFENSKILARKMTQMYKLCSEQLSQQVSREKSPIKLESILRCNSVYIRSWCSA